MEKKQEQQEKVEMGEEGGVMGKHAPTPTTKKFKHKPTQPPMYPNNTRSFTFAVVAVFFAVHMVEATRKAPRPRPH